MWQERLVVSSAPLDKGSEGRELRVGRGVGPPVVAKGRILMSSTMPRGPGSVFVVPHFSLEE